MGHTNAGPGMADPPLEAMPNNTAWHGQCEQSHASRSALDPIKGVNGSAIWPARAWPRDPRFRPPASLPVISSCSRWWPEPPFPTPSAVIVLRSLEGTSKNARSRSRSRLSARSAAATDLEARLWCAFGDFLSCPKLGKVLIKPLFRRSIRGPHWGLGGPHGLPRELFTGALD